MGFLLDTGCGQAEVVEGPRAAAAAAAAPEHEKARLLRTQVSEDLRTFFASVGGLQSLMQDIAPAVFRASVTEVRTLLVMQALLAIRSPPVTPPKMRE